MTNYDQKRIRTGKTQKDREAGAFERNAQNKRLRAAWDQGSKSTNSNFPRETCNGRRNRYIK